MDTQDLTTLRSGKVKFYDSKKGYGFIRHEGEEYFVHATGLSDNEHIREDDEVTFTLKEGKKGLNAINVRRT